MYKHPPGPRRDSVHSRVSGGSSSQNSPPPFNLPLQPQHHQPNMAAQPPQTFKDKNGREWTKEELQELDRRKQAALQAQLSQMTPEQQAHIRQQYQQRQHQQHQRPQSAMATAASPTWPYYTASDGRTYTREQFEAVLLQMSPQQRQCYQTLQQQQQIQQMQQRRQQTAVTTSPAQAYIADDNGRRYTRAESEAVYAQMSPHQRQNFQYQQQKQQREREFQNQQSQQPQQMAAETASPTQAWFTDKNGRRYTREQFEAAVSQMNPEHRQRAQLNQQRQYQQPRQQSFMNPRGISSPMGYSPTQASTLWPHSPLSTSPTMGFLPTQKNPMWPPSTRSPTTLGPNYATDLRSTSRSSHPNPHPRKLSISTSQSANPMPVDPRPATLSATNNPMSSPLPSELGKEAPVQGRPTPIARSSCVAGQPQVAGTKRPLADSKDACAEGPIPKVAMFSTAPPQRPSSAQGFPKAAFGTKPNTKVMSANRLNKEAAKRGVRKLEVPKGRFNVSDREMNDLQKPGHATAAPPPYAQEMMEIKKKAALELLRKNDSVSAEAEKGQKSAAQEDSVNALVGAPAGPASVMGGPARHASATSQTKAHAIIDLTGPEEKPQPIAASPCTAVFGSSSLQEAGNPHNEEAAKHRLYTHAEQYGVNMADVEYGSVIHDSMENYLFTQQEIRGRNSLPEPSDANVPPIAKSSSSVRSAGNTMDAAHAEALGLPKDFSMYPVLKKVRGQNYDGYATYSGNNGGELPNISQSAKELCTRDGDGSLRAPDDVEMSEEGANLRYEMFMLAAEQGCAHWGADAKGKATWR